MGRAGQALKQALKIYGISQNKLAIAQLKSVKLNYLQLKPQIEAQDTQSQHPVQDVEIVALI